MELKALINEISQTAFLTLQCHAMDARSDRPLLNDRSAVQTLEELKAAFGSTSAKLYKRIMNDRVQKNLVVHIVLRAKRYDDYIRDYLDRYPDAAVVNIGCGLDNRFGRIDNGRASFYDLDLPDIMNIKKQIFPPRERYKQISQSVFTYDWLDQIDGPNVILVAEGVFMYCEERDVKQLFHQFSTRLQNPEIVLEVVNRKWLSGWRRKAMEIKMKKEMRLGEDTLFKFGISDSDEIETWHPGYRLLDEWSYFDSPEGPFILRFFRHMDALRKVQWTVRYMLGR